jgi:DNA-binding transcriptional ArsR family regulator
MPSRSLLWYLLAGTRGSPNRRRIVERLERMPHNAHQLSAELGLDYRTVRHHLSLLESAGLISRPLGGVYGSPYEVTAHLMANLPALEELDRAGVSRATHRSSGAPGPVG